MVTIPVTRHLRDGIRTLFHRTPTQSRDHLAFRLQSMVIKARHKPVKRPKMVWVAGELSHRHLNPPTSRHKPVKCPKMLWVAGEPSHRHLNPPTSRQRTRHKLVKRLKAVRIAGELSHRHLDPATSRQ
jgi:hypothetical protein